ncbi:MAG: repeat domain protein, partial [Deltaproteobacteria bacterium]|nr:repeat domain protein [Deltaproteobacteria bacterium]
RAEAVSWPVSISNELAVGITPVGPRTLRLGPARTAFADVISACPPSTLSAVASTGAAGVTGVPTIEAWNRVRFRFDGLGPFVYSVTVRSCEGSVDGTLDAAERGRQRHPIPTLATGPHSGHSPLGKAVQLVAHGTRGCVVTDAGELGCFKRVYRRTDLQRPRLLASWLDLGKLASPGTTAQIAGVGPSWCARAVDGEVWCWGDSGYGMFGDNRRHVDANAPAHVPLPSRAIDLAVSGQHACARVETGAVLCWGWNGYGQLGLGERNELVTVPREVPGFRGATMLALSRTSTCAVLAGGDVACAGRDKFAEIGVGPRWDRAGGAHAASGARRRGQGSAGDRGHRDVRRRRHRSSPHLGSGAGTATRARQLRATRRNHRVQRRHRLGVATNHHRSVARALGSNTAILGLEPRDHGSTVARYRSRSPPRFEMKTNSQPFAESAGSAS